MNCLFTSGICTLGQLGFHMRCIVLKFGHIKCLGGCFVDSGAKVKASAKTNCHDQKIRGDA